MWLQGVDDAERMLLMKIEAACGNRLAKPLDNLLKDIQMSGEPMRDIQATLESMRDTQTSPKPMKNIYRNEEGMEKQHAESSRGAPDIASNIDIHVKVCFADATAPPSL